MPMITSGESSSAGRLVHLSAWKGRLYMRIRFAKDEVQGPTILGHRLTHHESFTSILGPSCKPISSDHENGLPMAYETGLKHRGEEIAAVAPGLPQSPQPAWLGVTCWLFQRIVSGCGRSSCSHHVPLMFLSCSGGSSPRWNLAKTLVVKVPEDQAILYTVKIHENTINIGPIRFDWVYIMIGLWIYSDYLGLVLDL